MFQDISDEYLERVEECRIEARRCSRAEDREAWLSLAEEWLRLALRNPPQMRTEEPLQHEPTKQAA